jgi:hypothetical protein
METFSGIVEGIAVSVITALTLHHLLTPKLSAKILLLPEERINKFSRSS